MTRLPPVGALVQTRRFGYGVVVPSFDDGSPWPHRDDVVRVHLHTGEWVWLTADEIEEVLPGEAQ